MGASASVIIVTILKSLYIIMQIVVEIMGSPLGEEYTNWYKREKEIRRNASKPISVKEIF